MTIAAGTKLGRYEIRAQLGKGGMGEVYLAEDARLNRKVALKLLPHELTDNKDRLLRFEREARAASALNHPNILTIYEIGASDGVSFIATEFIDGETLRQKLDGPALSLAETLDLAIQIASALSAAHDAGIVHRDIKPENIMLRRDGIVKVLDFGLAKTVGTPAALDPESPTRPLARTDPGVVLGTVNYMSPEQARGRRVDARTDIWSLGVVLYEIIAGSKPFAGETASDIIAAILKTNPAPLKEIAPETPTELQRIVGKMLRDDQEARYQNTKDLLVDLKSLKQELEFAAKLERSVPPPEVNTQSQNPATLAPPAPVDTQSSSAEYIVTQIKHYKRTVGVALAALLVAVIGLGYYFTRSKTLVEPAGAAIDSIAVLPFENTSQDSNREYLSDGITENIINTLSRLPSLRVLPRSTVFRFKGKVGDPQKIGQTLGVRAVLTGKVVQRENQLLIQTELIDVATGAQLWGEHYNRPLADVLTVQENIATEITTNLRLTLTGAEKQQLAKRYTDNIDAYQLYLKGRFYWNKRTEENYQKAIDYFQQAIDKDPNYALAYTGLADTYSFLSSQGISLPREVFPLAKTAATKAIAVDDTLAEAHTSLAYIKLYYDWDWAGAEQEYRRAIQLNPNYATPHHGYAYYLISIGRTEEGIAEIKRAAQIDPLSLVINADQGEFYYFAHRPDESIAQLQKAVDLDPGFVRAHFLLARSYAQKGRCKEAIAEFQRARALDSGVEMLGAIGQGYASCGKRDEARQVMKQLLEMSRQHYVSPHWIASIYAGLGDKDEAFDWLNKAFENRFGPLIYLKVNPIWDPLRADPRFAGELRRVGLPQ